MLIELSACDKNGFKNCCAACWKNYKFKHEEHNQKNKGK